ncbi:MAG: helix-turn-helix domain-containing protein [Bacteroidota bacterium]
MLGTNRKYLNAAINQNTTENFRTIINRYRVDEAKRIIEATVLQDAPIVISDLVISSGFNSYTSFYRAFRMETGLIPKDYITEEKKAQKVKSE